MQIPFARLALAFAVTTEANAALIYTLPPGESVKATLYVSAYARAFSHDIRNAEIPFMFSLGGVRIECTNCPHDSIRGRASFVWDGLMMFSNYLAYVPNLSHAEVYDLTLTAPSYLPFPAQLLAGDNLKIVRIPESSTWLLMACGLALIAFCAGLNELRAIL